MTPEDSADAALMLTSTEELLRKFAHLTHMIHALERDSPLPFEFEKRAMRDLIKDEILKRTGDLK